MSKDDRFLEAFLQLPRQIRSYFLDTCVWTEIISFQNVTDHFVSYFQENNLLAALTPYTIFELSRAAKVLPALDVLFFELRHNIWVPLLYDQLFNLELASYPNPPDMRWMPISLITDENNPRVMSKLAMDPRITQTRDEHLQFGEARYMDLAKFKENFPTSAGDQYTTDQAYQFARLNGWDYFLRHMPEFLIKFGENPSNFQPEGLPSQYIRSLFVFYNYYIHGRSPSRSDFLDFAHLSYAPYVNVYVTDRKVLNVLRHIKSSQLYLAGCSLLHVSDFPKSIGSSLESDRPTTQ